MNYITDLMNRLWVACTLLLWAVGGALTRDGISTGRTFGEELLDANHATWAASQSQQAYIEHMALMDACVDERSTLSTTDHSQP